MKELISLIVNDIELSNEDKIDLLEKMVNASHGLDSFVAPGFYLHTDKNEQTGELNMQLWFRNEDENGMTSHGPTNYSSEMIIEMMKKECLNKKGNVK